MQSSLETSVRPVVPTIRSVNLLYLLALILLVTLGSIAQVWDALLGVIFTEWVLILAPALLFLRLKRLPVAESLRLRWPGTGLVGLSLFAGGGMAIFVVWLTTALTGLLDYNFPISPELYPTTALEAVLVFFGLAISAPICEETLFRGVIQRGYERRGAWFAILFVGLLFAGFHMSFLRLLALSPISLVLGYVAWRSSSLIGSMLVHFAYNALTTMVLITSSFRPGMQFTLLQQPWFSFLGLLVSLAALWLLYRLTRPQPLSEDQLEPEKAGWLGRSWPLGVATLIFLVMAAGELVVARFPEALALNRLSLPADPWQSPESWSYRIVNVLDEPVGRAECRRSLEPDTYLLECDIEQQAYEAELPGSFFSNETFEATRSIRWDRESMNLREARFERQGEGQSLTVLVDPQDDQMVMTVTSGGEAPQRVTLPADGLIEGEWPWRVAADNLSIAQADQVTLGIPLEWSEAEGASRPTVVEGTLLVLTAEPLAVPAGNFIAYRVTIGDETAWYDSDKPHTLLQYDNGMETYQLSEIRSGL